MRDVVAYVPNSRQVHRDALDLLLYAIFEDVKIFRCETRDFCIQLFEISTFPSDSDVGLINDEHRHYHLLRFHANCRRTFGLRLGRCHSAENCSAEKKKQS